MRALLLWGLLVLGGIAQAAPFDHRHAAWNGLLERHVHWVRAGVASTVDYPALAGERRSLDGYLAQLSAVSPTEFNGWSRDQRLAFLINAYNAFTVRLILDHYPVDSIKDIGSLFSSPWKRRFIALLGRTLSLDELEHGLIREPGVYDEPRIHFVVNCASIGCPALRPQALVAEQLEEQLEDSLRRFLSDRQRNRYERPGSRLQVSKIFDWYGEDFARQAGSVSRYLAERAEWLSDDPADRHRIRQGAGVGYLDYDWSLNGTPRTGGPG